MIHEVVAPKLEITEKTVAQWRNLPWVEVPLNNFDSVTIEEGIRTTVILNSGEQTILYSGNEVHELFAPSDMDILCVVSSPVRQYSISDFVEKKKITVRVLLQGEQHVIQTHSGQYVCTRPKKQLYSRESNQSPEIWHQHFMQTLQQTIDSATKHFDETGGNI